jgi:rhodanese-related sulfurtransferase
MRAAGLALVSLSLGSLAMLGGCATSAAEKFATPVMSEPSVVMSEPAVDGRMARAPRAGVDTAEATIDYRAFSALTGDLAQYREGRRVTLAQFKQMARDRNTLILDARSASAYGRGHIGGAINLPFTDFTAQSLAAAIGDPNRRILIYCNNNFANNAQPVMLKAAPLALNIPTFINLVGYGYKNVFELRDVVDFNDPAVGWVTSSP